MLKNPEFLLPLLSSAKAESFINTKTLKTLLLNSAITKSSPKNGRNKKVS